MTLRIRLPLIALAVSLPLPAAAQSVQDFTLEPAPTPTPTSRAQGPVDTESGVVPVAPREISTGQPTPRATAAPTPTPTPTPSPTAIPTSRSTGSAAPRPVPSTAPRAVVPEPVDRRVPVPIATPLPTPVERDPASTAEVLNTNPQITNEAGSPDISATPPSQAVESDETESSWPLMLGGAALLALLAGAAMFWRRCRANGPAPTIERPVVSGSAPESLTAKDAMLVRCEVVKLTRSAMYATLKYRLTLVNRTDRAMADVRVGIDLASAHAGAPMEQQVATDATALETRHVLPRISPRQNVRVEGEVKLPLAAAQIIRQGKLPLLVPLMRVRVDGAGEGALVKTFVVGQGTPDSGRVQPFRLDDAPQSYQPIAQRELA